MNWIDVQFKYLIMDILKDGCDSPELRPVYSDGTQAKTKYTTAHVARYDLIMGQFPLTQLRPLPWKSAIQEILWIYQDQSNRLEELHDRGVNYWDDWDLGDGTIGNRYGYTVKKYKIIDNLLEGLAQNPFNRRNVIDLWQYEDLESSEGLKPCAFNIMFDVRDIGDDRYLDAILTQRSSDMLVAYHINQIQYIALQMMIAKHFGWKVGEFVHTVMNLHIYDNQFEQAEVLLDRNYTHGLRPKLVLDVPDGTNFYDITIDDFSVKNYDPIRPNLKFDLAV